MTASPTCGVGQLCGHGAYSCLEISRDEQVGEGKNQLGESGIRWESGGGVGTVDSKWGPGQNTLAGLVRKTVAPALSHLPLGIKDFIVTLLAFCQAQFLSSSCRPNSTPRGSQLPHQCKDTRMRDTVLEREAKRRGGEERGTLFQLRAGPGTGPWGEHHTQADHQRVEEEITLSCLYGISILVHPVQSNRSSW